MFFLIRVTFWLSIVVLLLPSGQPRQAAQAPGLDAVDALFAASAAVSDMGQFCSRQPAACTVGSQAAVAFGHKAQAGATMIYEFLTEQVAGEPTGSVAGASAPARTDAATSQNTLTPADRTPAWRGPRPA